MEDRGSGSSDLAFLLGGIKADIAHVLTVLSKNQEQFDTIDKKFSGVEARINQVEKFNVKVLGMAAVAVPVLMLVLELTLRKFGM